MSQLMKNACKWFRGMKKEKNKVDVEGKANIDYSECAKEVPNNFEEKMNTKDVSQTLKNKGKLFVGGLNYATTSEGLKTYFSQFGKVIDYVVMKFPDTGRSRGFGFVTFVNEDDAETAIQKDQHILDGKLIDVRRFTATVPGSKIQRNKNNLKVFLGNLPFAVSTEVVMQFFRRYGEISQVVIPVDKNTKKSKGFGFIWFKDEDAVEKCVAEGFVYLNGRRVNIRRADFQSLSQVTNLSEEKGLRDHSDDEFLTEDPAFWMGESTSSVADENCVLNLEKEIDEESEAKKLFEDYFSAKLANFSDMNVAKTEKDISELEKSLAQLLLNYSKENKALEQDLIEFSDDSESEERNGSDDETSTDSSCGGDDDIDDRENNFTNALDVPSSKFEALLTGILLPNAAKVSDLRDLQSEFDRDFQNLAPIQFKDNKGLLICSLCEWSPSDNSNKSFLAHCQTAAHRVKLKERFLKKSSDGTKESKVNKQALETHTKVGNISSKPKSVPQKSQTVIQQEVSKNQNKVQFLQNSKSPEAEQIELTRKKNAEKKKIKKKKTETPNVPINTKSEPKKKISEEKIRDLKVTALAKGMSSIRPLSNGILKCTLCNKEIPKTPEISILMKNVSHHLQSKGHLKRLLQQSTDVENSLKKSQKKNQEETNFSNTNPQGNTKIPQEQKISNQKNIQVETKKKATAKKHEIKPSNRQENTSTSKLFVCLLCNYFNKNIEKFRAHLKSKTHLDCFASKGVNPDLLMDNLTECKSCGLFLFGSLLCINEHYTKCVKKKAKAESNKYNL